MSTGSAQTLRDHLIRMCAAFHAAGVARFVRDGFLHDDRVEFTEAATGAIRGMGTLACAGRFICSVDVTYEVVDGTPRAMAFVYDVSTPNKHLAAMGSVFRYESVPAAPGHPPRALRRVFDPANGAETIQSLGSPPSVADVLQAVRQVYWASLEN